MNFIKDLSNKLQLSIEDIYKKLNIDENSSRINVLKALGVYSIFENKEELEQYLNEKLENKNKEINNLKEQFSDFETIKKEAEKSNALKEKINSVVDAELNKIKFLNKVDHSKIDIDKLNFSDLKISILKQAKELNWEIKQEIPEIKNENNNKQNNITNMRFFGNGIITKN